MTINHSSASLNTGILNKNTDLSYFSPKLFVAYWNAEGMRDESIAMLPLLMDVRKSDSEIVVILFTIGADREIEWPMYYRTVVDGCSMDYLMANPDLRKMARERPHYFFNVNEVDFMLKKYGLMG